MSTTQVQIDDSDVVNLLYRTGPSALAASFVASLAMTFLMWATSLGAYALIWFLVSVVIGVSRLLLIRRYRHASIEQAAGSRESWMTRFDYGVAVNGVIWGVGGFVVASVPDFVIQLVLALCLCGLFAGTIATYFAHPRSVFLFATPALLPFALAMLANDTREQALVGGLMLAFFGIASIVALQVHDSLDHLSTTSKKDKERESETPKNEPLERRRIEHLYKNAVSSVLGASAGALVLVFLLRESIDLNVAFWWLVALGLAVTLRLLKVFEYRRGVLAEPLPGYWLLNFNYPLMIVGLTWSIGAIALPQNMLGDMLMMVCIFGLVAGAASAFASHMSTVLSLAMPSVIPFGIYLTVQPDELHATLGFALFFFSTLLVVSGTRFGRIVYESFAHEVENELLISSLTEHTNTIESLNDKLESRVRMRTEELQLLVAELSERSDELKSSRKRYRDIVEHTHELIQSVDKTGRVIFANSAWKETLGYSDEELEEGVNIFDLISPNDQEHCATMFARLLHGDHVDNAEFELIAKSGQTVEVEGSIRSAFDESARDATFGVFRNVTAANAADAALQSSEARYHAIFSRSSIGILIVDKSLDVVDANPHACQILDRPFGTLRGNAIRTLAQPQHRAVLEERVRQLFADSLGGSRVEMLCARDGNESFWAELELAAIMDSAGTTRFVVVIMRDISERKALADVLEHNASHDYLTGLVNRREFERRLRDGIETASRNAPHALIYFDLDRFKIINDTCGHSTGDALLRSLSKTLADFVPEDCDLARIGGDEFALLVPATTTGEADVVARALITAVDDFRFEYENRVHTVGVSAGIVMLRGDETDTDAMQSADAACYAAKRAGRGRIEFYDGEQSDMRLQRDQIRAASALANAMNDGRLSLVAQPIASIGGDTVGVIERYELLLRVEDEHGHVSGPGALLPAAEKYGYAMEIDKWVVRTAIDALKQFDYGQTSTLTLSINLSAQSLLSEQFEESLAAALENFAFSGNLCFEITENQFMSNFERAESFMQRMRQFGCRFALDDFGTGFSSYGYLKALNIDFLKIDGTFVRNIDSNPVDEAIVTSIIGVARAMKMTTIAEYVERESQIDVLRRIGVDMIQGYAIGRETPLGDVLHKSTRAKTGG